MIEIIKLVVHKTGGVLELALHFLHISRLLLDDSLHLLSQLLLQHLLALVELLLDLLRPSLVFFKTLLTLHLGLVDSVVHAIDFGLLLLDHHLQLHDLLLEPFNRLV